MRVVHVIPIGKGMAKDKLSYWSASPVKVGSIVSIPLRNKKSSAIVAETEDVSEAKSALRSSAFRIKKLDKVKAEGLLSPAFVEAALEMSRFSASSVGAVLNALIPKSILEKPPKPSSSPVRSKSSASGYAGYVIQSPDEERLADFKSFIREEFARGRSVFFCLPTLRELERTVSSIEKGIAGYTYVFHGGLPAKKLAELWKAAAEEKHPVLIVCTYMFLGIPRDDVGTIILESEHSRSYRLSARPYLDFRVFAEIYAKKLGVRFIAGDSLLSSETIWRHWEGELYEAVPPKFRFLSSAKQNLVDMRNSFGASAPAGREKAENKKTFRVIGEDAEKIISSAREAGDRTFIFNVRKGLFPLSVCGDCGSVVRCRLCSAPLVLHRSSGKNIFICHTCGEKRPPEDKCDNCGGWKLETLGIGVELVHEAVKKTFPDIKIFRLDGDTAGTHKECLSIMEKFKATPGSVLLGTELALSYLDQPIENGLVVSLDSLFSVPDFRINEKVFNILMRLRSFSIKNFLVQTRNPEQRAVLCALSGNAMDFYRSELDLRRQFGYPPFSVLIKITLSGSGKPAVSAEMKKLSEYFSGYEFQAFPAFTSTVKGKYVMHGLLRLSPEKWVDEALLEKLRALPPKFSVKVNPDSLL